MNQKQFDAIDDPLAVEFEVKRFVGLFATQEYAPHTTACNLYELPEYLCVAV